ncbi:hypothetical protein [Bradyrhizobium icense]|uniref:hypothetical protein n=1 Tax=Bradyrhizobium icense TaxID=1274631 RepID=UPI0012EAE2EC|nr:hypothetical protein [Bradyrhizobium icense]
MIASLELAPVRIDFLRMMPEGCEIVPFVEFASDESKEPKERLQACCAIERPAALVTKLEHRDRLIDQRGRLRPGNRCQ